VGHFHRGCDHSHRAVDGLLHALCAHRKDSGSLNLWRHAAAARGVGGKLVYQSRTGRSSSACTTSPSPGSIIGYGVISSSLPVWLLLARTRLFEHVYETRHHFRARVRHPARVAQSTDARLTRFTDGSGLIVAGKIFPFASSPSRAGRFPVFTPHRSGTTPSSSRAKAMAQPIGYVQCVVNRSWPSWRLSPPAP